MQWLNKIVDELERRHPNSEILIESGITPSGSYHFGHMREMLTPDAIMLELHRRGRAAKHVHYVDDLDALRKIPVNVPASYEQYLGTPLCDIPAPDSSDRSYADYFLQDLIEASKNLGIEAEFVRSHQKYREGFMVPAIERVLEHVPEARHALETVAGRQLDEHWSPIQVMEHGRLKKRKFIRIDTDVKLIHYEDADGNEQTVRYDQGEVKLDWRLDWPGRWWLLNVQCEPSGRDHMTKGSSYDTGVQIMKDVFRAEPPYPVAFDFINMVGDTKKMSSSKGTGLGVIEASLLMPAEVMRYFVFRSPASKRLYFDPVHGVVQLIDEFGELANKPNRTESEEQLFYICTHGRGSQTVSPVPFSHLVASYQASLRNVDKTLEVVKRTEHATTVEKAGEVIRNELKFIDAWLDKRAPDDMKFSLLEKINSDDFSPAQKEYFIRLAETIVDAPDDADGEWFHKAIYDLKEDVATLPPKELFTSLYQLLIGKTSGPRAGWFLSILPRDWLIKRLKLED